LRKKCERLEQQKLLTKKNKPTKNNTMRLRLDNVKVGEQLASKGGSGATVYNCIVDMMAVRYETSFIY